MTPERWQRIKELFTGAQERAAGERAAYLAAACGGDEALRAEVEALLAAHEAPNPVDALAAAWVTPLLRHLDAPPAQGHRVGPYEVVDEIGRGGMGRVYRAHDPRLGRTVALKLLPAHLNTQADAKARFLAEARAASALDHPHICTIYEADEDAEGRLYIAMACYDGPTLQELLRAGPLPVARSVELARQVADGLRCAHAAGIIHRDVKPANLIVTRQGAVKILDFGIAKLEGTATRTGARVGTAAYMAPEQVRGGPVDARTDLWALGVVLFEMLTGTRPFAGDTEAALLHAVLHAEPPAVQALRPEVPPALAEVVRRMLARAPEARFRDALAFMEALRHAAEGAGRPPGRTLPPPLTRLVGRAQEVGQAAGLLAHVRLLTLTGPGGIGKTRLALAVAAAVADRFPGGTCLVELAALTDPGLVASAIAHALGLTNLAGRPVVDMLKQALAGEAVLLVLDNFEQVSAAASVVRELLQACPALRVLVTSRIPLGMAGEQELPVPPLAGPALDADLAPDTLLRTPAVQLFVERARAVRPGFTLTPDEAGAVAALCRRLDGLPLAIELAAARIKLFTPAVLLSRLTDRLDVLKGGGHDRPLRHRTLSQAIAWSYDLLDTPTQGCFRHLAVFRGGFTLEAAEAVYAGDLDVVDAVAALLDQSLLQPRAEGAVPRYTMLETIRTFGLEQLEAAGEGPAVRARHAEYLLHLSEAAAVELTGPEQAVAMDRLEAEHDNLRAALAYLGAREAAEPGLRLGAALWRFWLARGYLSEGLSWLHRFLSMPGPAVPAVRARALHGAGTLAHNRGDNEQARRYLVESLALWRAAGEAGGVAAALNNLAWVACEMSDLEPAHRLAAEALALCRTLHDRRGTALALNNLGWVALYQGHTGTAHTLFLESLVLRREDGDLRGIAFALTNVAYAEVLGGDYVQAAQRLDEAFDRLGVAKDTLLSSWALTIRGQLAHHMGRTDAAAEMLTEAVARWRTVGNRSGLAYALAERGRVALAQGAPAQARAMLAEARTCYEAIGCRWGVAYAEHGLGQAAYAAGDVAAARAACAASLETCRRLGDHRGQAECLEMMARIEAAREAPRPPIRLLK